MIVLIVEDQETSLNRIKDILMENEYEEKNILIAPNLYDAKKLFQNNYDKIGAIVTDLNMDPCFLAKNEKHLIEVCGTNFSGWVWLKYYVFNLTEDWSKKTALRSAYIADLKTKLKYADENEKNLFNIVKHINRKDDRDCKELLPWLNKLCNKKAKKHLK